MQDDKKKGYVKSFWEKLMMRLTIRKTIRKTKANIRTGRMMAAFYSSLAAKADSKEMKGKLGLKVGQLDDSTAQEMRFLEFISDFSVDDPRLWRGIDD